MKISSIALLVALFYPQGTLWCQTLVLQVAEESEAGRAGIRQGDLLSQWTRGADAGEIRSPFEVAILELDTAGGPPVTLLGRRGAVELRWTLKGVPWGVTVGPSVLGAPPTAYLDGQRLVAAGQLADAAMHWERAADQTTGVEAVWLLSRAGETFAAARLWENSDRAFTAALQKGADEAASRLQLERMWADSLYQRSAWDQAKTHYDRALAEAERIRSLGTQAAVLYEIGRLYIDRRRPDESLPYLERSLNIRRELGSESIPVAQVVNTLGRAFLASGDLKQARQYFQESLALYEKFSPETTQVAAILHNLGVVALERDDLDPAENYFQRSLGITVRLAPNGTQWANTATSLANIARIRGNLVLAERYLDQVLAIRRKLQPDSLFLSSALNGLGNLHRERGELARADIEYREALSINTKLAPMSREVGGTLENLGTIAQLRGDWALALTYSWQAVEIWEKVSPGTVFWAKALANLALTLENLGKFDEAEQQYRNVLKSFAVHEVDPLSAAKVTQSLGALQEHRGQARLADESYTNAFDILSREIPDSIATGDAALHIAELARRQKQWTRAESYYRKSLSISERIVPDTEQVARPLYGLAMVAQHYGQKEAATSFFSRALQAFEKQAPQIGGSEQSQAVLRASYAPFYQDYLLFLVSENRSAEAFAVLERSRARALLQMLAERDLELKDVPAELDRERRQNAADYDRAQVMMAGLSPEKDTAALSTLQSRLLELTAERAHIVDKIRQASPHDAEVHYPAPLDLEQARAALDPETVLISFAVTPARTLMFVVRPIGFGPAITAFTIPVDEKDLREKVRNFRKAIEERTFSSQASLFRDGRALYDLLLRPAEALVAPAKHLLIIPDGPLDSVPFGALRRGPNQFLIEWKPVHSALSATLYGELKRARRPGKSYRFSLAAFGDPAYGAAELSNSSSSPAELSAVLHGTDLRPLRFSREEVQQIAALYSDEKEVFLGRDATEGHAKTLGMDVRYIHFSVHAFVDEHFPLNSALVLTRPESLAEGEENGLLQAWELYTGVRWDADLAVLSACQSALGQEFAGEGLFGLARAVHYAGARSVIASLWSVDDQQTQLLMTALYRHLGAGQPKDEALRSAQLELLATRTGASPFYWASFVLSGDWR